MKQNVSSTEDVVIFKSKIRKDNNNKEMLVIPLNIGIYLDIRAGDVLLYRVNNNVLELARTEDVENEQEYKKISLFKNNNSEEQVGLYYPEEVINEWKFKDHRVVTITFSFIDLKIRIRPKL